MMDWYFYPLVIAGGFLSGFINTLAGIGSLVTLPLLIFLGLPPAVANGTNRVAILLQNVVGGRGFHARDYLDVRGAIALGLPAMAGAIIGAQIAVNLDERLLERVIGLLMVAMLVVILIRPEQWLQGDRERRSGSLDWKQLAIFFLIGIYGGFIQVGVGVFLLAGLVLVSGYDLVHANAVKVGIVFLFTVTALAVFMLNNQVDWFIGAILSIGSMLGAWFGARTAVEKGAVWVRRLLIVIVVISAANLLG